MSSTSQELARREERAQGGIIQFAEEMQAIRRGHLYPDAGQEPEAWATYCKTRWDMSERSVEYVIQAMPVLRRLTRTGGSGGMPSTRTAAIVAALPEAVQDAILDETVNRDVVQAKAAAVRKAVKRIEVTEGREASDEDLITAAATVKAPPKPKKKPKHKSRFTSLLAQAVALAEDAADYAQSNVLSDIENEYGWSRVEKLRYHADRIADVLTRPDHVRDMDEEFAELLIEGGEQS